ncbi:uncharacterized protein LOC101860609 [Aplysia californica]|uniref:Uncharacterized protein LOC101860609 n=1 Tax=Aplysia californica TaxID=6500 RepID=A0ABM1W1I5_APLCA|nr:uncharacterized protein LOC101860609 [Aplysia californica]XP_035828527.1 uncharacterized protein LOC101860609 [Aplysia californica]XP_035828528.1 uncharacterized protein LOC101860609 [Aplysia californica]
MSSDLSYEASDEASENELLDRSLSVWRGWSAIDWEDFTPVPLDLHTACSIGQYDWVRAIISKKEADSLDRKNLGGWTPLMYACYIGHDNIVNLLIHAGCSKDVKNPRGHTPLMLAASCGNETVARTLVRNGAGLDLVDKFGLTALFHATYAGHQNFVAFLLEAGASTDALEPGTGMTPLMKAASEGHEIIVQLFLKHGVNVHAKAYNGDTARSTALLNGYMKIVSLIDNHILPPGCLRTEPGLDFYLSSSDEAPSRKRQLANGNVRGKIRGPSIRDGPEAIARMIGRTRNPETAGGHSPQLSRGYVGFPSEEEGKEQRHLSYREVTSPINPDDFTDSPGSRDADDCNDDSNAFTKTGAITIKSSSSSSGGLMAALGLSREGSIDSDDSPSYAARTGLSGVGKLKSSAADNDDASGGGFDGVGQEVRCDSADGNNRNARAGGLAPLIVPGSGDLQESLQTGERVGGGVSPLRDYFPVEVSFPVGVAPFPEAGDSRATGNRVPAEGVLPKGSDALPLENMTQTEIVNRFLNNLSVGDDTERGEGDIGGKLGPHKGVVNTGLNVTDIFSEISGPVPDKCLSGERVMERLERMRPAGDSAGIDQRSPQSLLGDSSLPGDPTSAPSFYNSSSLSSIHGSHLQQKHLETQPRQQHIQQQHIQQQQQQIQQPSSRAFLPRLNHHHPLHNRHSHNNVAAIQPIMGNPPAPASQPGNLLPPRSFPPGVSGKADQGLQSVPQQYFYRDIDTLGQFQSLPQVSAQAHPGSVHRNPPPAFLDADPPPGSDNVRLLSHLINPATPLTLAPNPPQPHPSSTATVPAGQTSGGGGEGGFALAPLTPAPSAPPASHPLSLPTHGPPLVVGKPRDGGSSLPPPPQMGPRPPDPSFGVNRPQMSQRVLPPSTAMFPGQSSLAPTSLSIAMAATGSVIIPGHATSQPVVSSAIGWLEQPGRPDASPRDLAQMLGELGLSKYLDKFEEQDVDLQVFLSLTDNDLKEIGIKLFGPRKKMTNAIARWHSHAPIGSDQVEQAYADRLEGEMQEMAIQLNQAYENEERLKAQVLQERQLRSVTESCLMEERAGWDRARRMLQETRSKMRTMGEILSRLRHHQKELRKQTVTAAKILSNPSTNMTSAAMSVTGDASRPGFHSPAVSLPPSSSANDPSFVKDAAQHPATHHALLGVGEEAAKKSDKCLKELQQLLCGLVLNADHILKSTHVVNGAGKENS